jgi:hypothetical protein
MDEVTVLRDLNHETIDQTVEKRKIWREMAEQRWSHNNQLFDLATSLRTHWSKISVDAVNNLHDLADTLLESKHDYKLVVTVNQGWLYTNHVALIQQVDQKNYLSYKSYSQAQIDRPKNTVKLKNSPYQYRSYIRHTVLQTTEKDNLQQFFYNNKNTIRVSPAFARWFDQSYIRTQDWFFIDHDSPQWLTMLSLVRPGLIRKTVQIILAK